MSSCLRRTITPDRRRSSPGPVPAPGANNPPAEEFENNVAYTIVLENKIVDLIGEALGKMQPVSLSYGIGRAHFALNRREPTAKGIKLGKNPAGPIDESVPILHVQGADGKPLAIVFGYACHNTTLRPDMMKIAADFAGYAQDRIEADYPAPSRCLSPAVRATPTPIRSEPLRWPKTTATNWAQRSSLSWITRPG